jgi:hypothetical protein
MGDRNMSGFYAEMADMVNELLLPDSQGGFGQGVVALLKLIPVEPENSWDEPPPPVPVAYLLRAVVKGVSAQLVGTIAYGGSTVSQYGDATIQSSDLEILCVPPAVSYSPGDILTLDGSPVTVIGYSDMPAVGTKVAVRFIARK